MCSCTWLHHLILDHLSPPPLLSCLLCFLWIVWKEGNKLDVPVSLKQKVVFQQYHEYTYVKKTDYTDTTYLEAELLYHG
jgi:hypothetical protein